MVRTSRAFRRSEPDWSRLLARISRMLSHGTVVAWFQGPMGFGPRSVGTRGILCDPSNRYARENINNKSNTEIGSGASITAQSVEDFAHVSGMTPRLASR